ncbi:hypothetical protein BDV29DRAFT_184045 [Aspergillus leporis]|uniref:Uncharacterized protein n=1 Tax=Aspergillus leporis TaxID=41062 RepID=A0A5N5WJK4_9EURO|nr:hypothetical protein BDV29DRAFT_184045 [Aspergillus leporis]
MDILSSSSIKCTQILAHRLSAVLNIALLGHRALLAATCLGHYPPRVTLLCYFSFKCLSELKENRNLLTNSGLA